MDDSFAKLSTEQQNETEEKIHLITNNTVTIPPHHISLVPLKAINQTINTKFPSEALLEKEDTNFKETRVLSTKCIHGSTMETQWSN